jgi:ABC-type bacteriocin/lantibiotic exporter with double-glycine peptidase domain
MAGRSEMDIPYRSQWDPDALQKRSDCGPACVAMVLDAFGQHVEINQLSQIDISDDGTTATELIGLLTKYGIQHARKSAAFVPPGICLVRYSGFSRANVQDKHYTGWHWVVLLDIDPQRVIVHDPDWWGSRRDEGAHHQFSIAEWDSAWLPYGNQGRIAIVWDEVNNV